MALKLVLLGPPGSGKGTYGLEISRKYGIPILSTGHMYREEVSKGSALGKKVKPIMEAGKLVPDEMTIKMMDSRLRQKDARKGYVLDGYPRSIAQAEALDKIATPNLVINLVIPKEMLLEKMLARRTCPKCGEMYNVADIRRTIGGKKYVLPPVLPKKSGICDKCGSKLIQRSDETPEIINKRFGTYEEQSAPLIEYYESEALLKNFSVTGGKSIMVPKILELIEEEMAENG